MDGQRDRERRPVRERVTRRRTNTALAAASNRQSRYTSFDLERGKGYG